MTYNRLRKYIEKILSLIFSFLLLLYLATGVHEQSHYVVAKLLGVDGYVTFGWFSGLFHYSTIPTWWQDKVIGFSGGFITGLIFLCLWYLSHFQCKYTDWELDDSFALGSVTIYQFVYAPFDAFGETSLIGDIGLILSVLVVLLIYGKRILKWLMSEAQEDIKCLKK